MKKRIVSGIQPSSDVIHIGNYLGALKNWVQLQYDAECIFFIADLHALTGPYDPQQLQKNIRNTVIAFLAVGIDPERSILFIQSQVKEHTELFWLLNSLCPVGELNRMTQYKEKSAKFKAQSNAGILNYPILQAADILLYKATSVPVGKDQLQHLELTRTLARKFNQKFGETFAEPQAEVSELGAKIMSLQDPKKKMSKSDHTDSYIGLFDEPAVITKKILKATTDTGKDIIYNPAKKPGISNLLAIYSLFSGKEIKALEQEFKGKGYGEFKKALADLLISSLESFRNKKTDLLAKEDYIQEILTKGAELARAIAQPTIEEVRKKMGLVA